MTGFFSSANYHICDCLPVTIVWMVRTHFGLCVSLLDLVVWRRAVVIATCMRPARLDQLGDDAAALANVSRSAARR